MKTLYTVIAIAAAIGIRMVLGRTASSQTSPPRDMTDEDIRDVALQGKKIQAIKYYRALHGVGLKEAKEAVEAMM